MSNPSPDYYTLLEIPPTATKEVIAAAFRRAIKACHPDRFPGDAEKEALAKALSRAKSVLLDEVARAKYDAARSGGAGADAKEAKAPRKGRSERATTAKRTRAAPGTASDGTSTRRTAKKRSPRKRSLRLVIELLGSRGYARKRWRPTAVR